MSEKAIFSPLEGGGVLGRKKENTPTQIAAAAVTYVLHLVTGWASLAAIAQVGAWINLFNLLPVWQLDGARGFPRAENNRHAESGYCG